MLQGRKIRVKYRFGQLVQQNQAAKDPSQNENKTSAAAPMHYDRRL